MNKKNILYIDDDVYSLLLLKAQLNKYKINILTENDGKSGLITYNKNKNNLDLIILDINLPYSSGEDILKIIRRNNKNIPIIIITARNSKEDKEHYLNLGANDFFIKPIKINDTLNIINKYIKQSVL